MNSFGVPKLLLDEIWNGVEILEKYDNIMDSSFNKQSTVQSISGYDGKICLTPGDF